MAELRVPAGPGMEEERCWGMKENTIPTMLGGAPEPNPARLTLDTSSRWCSPDSWLSLCFFLLFWGMFLTFWSSEIQCYLLVSCRVGICFGLTWIWGPRARSCPWGGFAGTRGGVTSSLSNSCPIEPNPPREPRPEGVWGGVGWV